MAIGRVLQFDPARGYGFVAPGDGGADVFLHASVFDGDADLLAPGKKIEFKISAGERGRKAFDARLIDDEEIVSSSDPGGGVWGGRPPGGAELRQELTELLMGDVPTLTGQQVVQIRQGMLEYARKHGWVDVP